MAIMVMSDLKQQILYLPFPPLSVLRPGLFTDSPQFSTLKEGEGGRMVVILEIGHGFCP